MQTEKYLNKVEGFKKITKLDRNWRKDLNADFKYPSSYKIIATAIISTILTTLIATIIDMIIGYDQIERNDIIGYCCNDTVAKNLVASVTEIETETELYLYIHLKIKS